MSRECLVRSAVPSVRSAANPPGGVLRSMVWSAGSLRRLGVGRDGVWPWSLAMTYRWAARLGAQAARLSRAVAAEVLAAARRRPRGSPTLPRIPAQTWTATGPRRAAAPRAARGRTARDLTDKPSAARDYRRYFALAITERRSEMPNSRPPAAASPDRARSGCVVMYRKGRTAQRRRGVGWWCPRPVRRGVSVRRGCLARCRAGAAGRRGASAWARRLRAARRAPAAGGGRWRVAGRRCRRLPAARRGAQVAPAGA